MSDAAADKTITERAFNEMLDAQGNVRPHYHAFAQWLASQPDEAMAARRLEADLNFRRIGITFSMAGDADGTERLIPFDLIPRIIPQQEWAHMQRGLVQRVMPDEEVAQEAEATARRIEELREQADAETLKLTLRALPVSKWAQALAAHRNDNGTNDMFGTAAAALPLMLDSATIGGKPVSDEDKTEQAWRNLFDELTDGQFTPLWQAIAELNGTAADPKAAFDLASQVLRN